jgi:hypothetical protein
MMQGVSVDARLSANIRPGLLECLHIHISAKLSYWVTVPKTYVQYWRTELNAIPLVRLAFNPLNAELNPICHLLILLGDLTFMGPCIVSIFQYISNKKQRYTVYVYLETALHVSGGTSTHYEERIQLYLQHLVFVTPLLLSADIAVGAVRHPQYTQTGSNSSTIAADSSNGVTITRCCRYSCIRSWWWVEVPPETCRAVSRYK